jgi:hypothetical protein
MKKTLDQTFRVVKLPASLVEAMRRQRDADGTTNLQFVGDAVAKNLPGIIEQLRSIGLCPQKGPKQAVRLPFSSQGGTLKALRVASNETGISAIQLLSLCLVAGTSSKSTKRGRGKRVASGRTSSKLGEAAKS